MRLTQQCINLKRYDKFLYGALDDRGEIVNGLALKRKIPQKLSPLQNYFEGLETQYKFSD